MTDHNATWSEEQYYQEDDLELDEPDTDPIGHGDRKGGYWDYPDDL